MGANPGAGHLKPERLVVIKSGTSAADDQPAQLTITYEELKSWFRHGEFMGRLFSFEVVRLRVFRLDLIFRPFTSMLLTWVLSRRQCEVVADDGNRMKVDFSSLLQTMLTELRNWFAHGALISRVNLIITNQASTALPSYKSLNLEVLLVYLRLDLPTGLQAGGSVGHIAGVVNSLSLAGHAPAFFSTEPIPTVLKSIETHILSPSHQFVDFPEYVSLECNGGYAQLIREGIAGRPVSFIYQRYTLNNFTGVTLARELNIPLVLEYNGSEVWISENWGGRKVRRKEIALKIESLNLHSADLIVVVSELLKDELTSQGIVPGKILVNPNGVDVNRYSPEIDGTQVRHQYGWQDEVVLGFIGTFGRWHGPEVLAEAFCNLLIIHPDLQGKIKLLMIGDGVLMPQVKKILQGSNFADHYVLTGLIPQEKGPQYLAACDILISPHIPNSDGSRFFGSPTKLFEYMAMGKAIIASNLDQLGQVIEDGKSGLLVPPGDIPSLENAMLSLIYDAPKRQRLGENARVAAVAHHSWRAHVENILEALKRMI